MWYKNEAYFTTGQFEKTGHTYRNHCGPTAITNIIMTLGARRYGYMPNISHAAERFRQIVSFGRHRAIYMNTDLFHLLGGTLDISVPFYLKQCLKKVGFTGCTVTRIRRLKPDSLREHITYGSMAYIIMRRHPVYGNHHLVCYGCDPADQFRCADGWHEGPVFLTASDMKYAKAVIIDDKGDLQS